MKIVYQALGIILISMFIQLDSECSQIFSQSISKIVKQRGNGWLGVGVEDVTAKLVKKKKLSVQSGAFITDVIEDSPAEEAGIQEGDVIVKFQGEDIDDSDDLVTNVRKTKPKTEVKIEVNRSGEKKTLTAKLGRVPQVSTYSFKFDDGAFPKATPEPFRFHFFNGDEFHGLKVQKLDKQLAEYFEVPSKKGLLITSVSKGSSAEKAGFKAGDVISKINNHTLRDVGDLIEEFRKSEGDEASLEIIRKGKSQNIRMKIEEDDDDMSEDIIHPLFPHHERGALLNFYPKFPNQQLHELKESMRQFKGILKEKLQRIQQEVKRIVLNS